MKKITWKQIVYPCIAVFIGLLDLVTKYFIVKNVPPNQPIEILGVFFRFVYIRNSGMVFGILSGVDAAWKMPALVIASLIAVAVVIYFYIKIDKFIKDGAPQDWGRIALMGILGGAIGNNFERIAFGSVTDFLDCGINESIRWFVFNVSDSFVVVGSIILAVLLIFFEKKHPKVEEKAGK
ncbi:MAG: signal peptidase II [Spirochaetes bacterium GWF1_51_8]|nr:MAG: signal peptidase II [Spirochaetes bacterium GWF1_51_8]